ncbi:PREDICTED: protein IWS1 homolog isoform X5 [Haliaeetus leucocephalus]|uniref:protein IWS1 homolog isoform X5 n=1 Tax=Haliaeetus leucocephalus TaxID=52644 RepID=UPI00053CBC9E|nr:PREDICTED: protein IWS1 homolog isoform X5 [Haliaeetus leucocephalus]
MESEYYDDGGATPVQDERDSGSDVEDEGNEQHSGSENGSVGHHSENEHSDAEDDGQMGEPHMTDSENEDIPRQKDSDSDNEEPRNHNVSDSDNEAAHGGKDSDSDTEDHPNRHLSDSENEDALNHRASDSENGEPHRDHSSDFENEESHKQPASDSESEELQKQPASDSESEELQKQPASDSESEELHKQPASDSESEDVSRQKQEVESEDSDGEDRKEEVQNDSHHSDNEHVREGFQGSDSEEEAPKRRKIPDSDEEEKEEEKTVKRKTAILSDSEDDSEKTPAKKVRILSDVEESDSDAASEKSDKRKKNIVSDSEEEEERKENAGKKKEEKDLFGSDSESGNEQENLIADIFGESGDEEEEEFTGFNQEDLEEEKGDADMKETADESDSDDNIKRGKHMDFMSDFDMMLQRKKSMSGKRRRNRDGGTFISDADDVVSAMIVKMNEAAEEDRQLNTQKKPALKKLTLLPTVVMHLKKQDLKETFIDSGVMSAIKEWLSPLPDRSLPALKIREELLKILQELPSVSQETLKHSGIGRAVMYLYKHPKESRPNKDMAGKLINEWSRPIFGLTSNYKGMTREEREQRDLEQMPQRRRLSRYSGGQTPRRDLEKVLTGEEKALRPGDPGFCARARVPMPSNKDYVVRPKWNVEMESSRFQGTSKKGVSRLDKQMRKFTDIRKKSRSAHAVKISIEGNKMPL